MALILGSVELLVELILFLLLTGLFPSNDLEQAAADMFSEGVFDLENASIRAYFNSDPDQKVR